MSLDVLGRAGVVPARSRSVRLLGWALRIDETATLVPEDRAACFGIVADCTHEDLDRLYSQDWVASYVVEPVLVDTDGAFTPALTYIRWEDADGHPSSEYIENIAGPAASLGFPDWYVEHIRSFI